MAIQSTLLEQTGQECFEKPPAHERLVLLPPAVCRFEALRQFNEARERLDLLEAPQVATVSAISERRTADQPSGNGVDPSDDELWVAEYSNAATRAQRSAQAISDALRNAPYAPIPRYLFQEPQKPKKDQQRPPEQSREYEDWIAKRIARRIYMLSPSTEPKPPLDAELPKSERVILLDKVCALTGIEKWAKEHKFSRTIVFEWKAAGCQPSKGKVSKEKSDKFWAAVLDDSEQLGLVTRTDSD